MQALRRRQRSPLDLGAVPESGAGHPQQVGDPPRRRLRQRRHGGARRSARPRLRSRRGLRGRGVRRPRDDPDRRDHRAQPGRGPRGDEHPAQGLRQQHDGVRRTRTGPHLRRGRRARRQDEVRGTPRARGGPRLPVQGGPGDPAPLHPRIPPHHDRGGRRGGRHPGGGLQARHDRRGHGLGLRQSPDLRGGDRRPRLSRRQGARAETRRGPERPARRLPVHGNVRGRGDAPGRRQAREDHRRPRHAQHAHRIPRQGPQGHGLHVPHAPGRGRQAHRRQGRVPAIPFAHLLVADPLAHPGRVRRDRGRHGLDGDRPGGLPGAPPRGPRPPTHVAAPPGRATFGLISAWFADIAHWFGSLL